VSRTLVKNPRGGRPSDLEGIPFADRSAALLGRAGAARMRRWCAKHRQSIRAWAILTPILIYYAIFAIAPVLMNLALSFTRWNGISGAPRWNGLANYAAYLQPPYPEIVANTFFFTVVTLIVQTVLAFLIAVLLNQRIFGLGLYRTLWYIPTLTPAAIMAQVALLFISPYNGVLNSILKSCGWDPVIWTASGDWMRFFVIMFNTWRGVGIPVVLFLAALQSIHRELYEAALVDGANAWQQMRFVTLPLLRPMILFVLVTGMIRGFHVFEAVYIMTKGGPLNQTNVMLLQIYNDAFVNNNLGVAAAGAMLMALFLLIFSLVSMKLMNQGQVGV
jgi:ABC-type sugar transport system permease subunit